MEKEIADKKAREAEEAAMAAQAEAVVAAAQAKAAGGGAADTEGDGEQLTEFDLALRRAQDGINTSKGFLEYAALHENNIEAAVLLGCPSALEFYAVKEEMTRLRIPRGADNYSAFLANLPEAGSEEAAAMASEIATANVTAKAVAKARPDAAAVKSMYAGQDVTMDDVYTVGPIVGVDITSEAASDSKAAYDALKSFASACGATVSQGYEAFAAERELLDPFVAYSAAKKDGSAVHFEQWYDAYHANAVTAMTNLGNPDLPFEEYKASGGKFSLEEWKQDMAKKSLPLLGGSKHSFNAFATFLKRDDLTPFYAEYKKLLNV